MGDAVCPEHNVAAFINLFNDYTTLLFCCHDFRDKVKSDLTEQLGETFLSNNAKFY